jgi:quercetin dioxygenase-like cupin family protein
VSAPERVDVPPRHAPPSPPPETPYFTAPTASLARAAAFADGPGRMVVPLLTPAEHGVPFALALQLAEGSTDAPRRLEAPRGAHALHFVLRGAACVALHEADDASSSQHTRGDADDAAACGLRDASGGSGPLLLRPGDCALSAPGARVSLAPALGGVRGDMLASLLLVLPSGTDGMDTDTAAAAAAARQWRSGARAPPLGDAGAATLLRRSAAWARLAAPPVAAAPAASDAGAPLRRRRLADADVFRLPGQSNRVALLYDPLGGGGGGVSFTASVEIYEPGHVTPRHTHAAGTELFLVLAGAAVAVCDGVAVRLRPGDAVAFPPGAEHALDVPAGASAGRCHVLQLLMPDKASEFAAFVRGGDGDGAALDAADLCALHAATQECPLETQSQAVEWHA